MLINQDTLSVPTIPCFKEVSVASPNPVKTILVVEDEPDMSIFLCNLLSANGFCPICAMSLSEGLKKAVDTCPDLVIINAMLPGEAGIRLFRCLRGSARLCHIPVIMLSTLDRNTYYRWSGAKRSHVGRHPPRPEAYLQKPPEAEELLSTVNRLCAGT
jgi:two-component system, OmpR family, phosphate regulon response regulator PhoB